MHSAYAELFKKYFNFSNSSELLRFADLSKYSIALFSFLEIASPFK